MTATIPLGELVTIRGGGTPSRTVPEYWNGSIRWATVKDFKSTELAETQETITPAGIRDSATNIIPAGSVIVPTRMAVGKAAISTIDLAINQDLKALLPTGEVDTRFLLHFMLSHSDYLESQAQGATVKGIKLDLLRSLPFPRLPRTEQRRIAAILDKADAIRRKREQALILADDFMRSVFLEMFGDPSTNSKGWPVGSIRDLIVDAKYGTSQKADVDEGSYPVLRMGNLTYSGRIDTTDLKYLDLNQKDVEKYTVRRGDILFNRTNSRELVGKTAVVMVDEVYAYAGYLVRARTNRKANPHYISAFLNSTFGKAILQGMCKSIVGMANINAQEFQNIRIPVPPVDLQNRFGAILERTEATRQLLLSDLRHAADLFSALSQRAFAGDL